MSEITIKLPDIGEGIAEAEIAEWEVEPGQWINEDDVLGTVLTDKAAVEIPSSVSGRVLWCAGAPGDMLAVGAPLVRIETDATGKTPSPPQSAADTQETRQVPAPVDIEPAAETAPPPTPDMEPAAETAARPAERAPMRPLAAPALRRRAADLGIDLAEIAGTGPEGRIGHGDLDRHLMDRTGTTPGSGADRITETKIIGLRRKIAQQMSRANARIPQITIIEEIDVTALEELRGQMNATRAETQPKLTLLPYLILAAARARQAAPQVNAVFDDDAEILRQHSALHMGIATQTERGLIVPVLRQADRHTVWGLASEITRLSRAAREGTLSREDLGGASMTVTSLGPLGAVATTPIVNPPEVAILGVNRKQTRPLWDGQAFVPREVMNISASFDHRIVDGWDAAQFIAALKRLLETPALIFVPTDDPAHP